MNTVPHFPVRARLLALVTVALAAQFVAMSDPVAAAPNRLTVTTTADTVVFNDGQYSLREAILDANGNGEWVIQLAATETYTLTRCSPNGDENVGIVGDLDVNWGQDTKNSLTIEGNGATITTTCPADRLFDMRSDGGTLRMFDVTFRGGRGLGAGGALRAVEVDKVDFDGVTVVGSVLDDDGCLSNCTPGGAVAIDNPTNFTMYRSTIADNRAQPTSCAIDCEFTAGLVVSAGNVVIDESIISDNTVVGGSCVANCRIAAGSDVSAGTVTIQRSTIAGNDATLSNGCSVCTATAGLHVLSSAVEIGNSTISRNSATGTATRSTGGVHVRQGSTKLISTTLVDNVGGTANNLAMTSTIPATVTVTGSVIGSTDSVSGCSLGTATMTATFSFESGTDCGLGTGNGNVSGAGNPRLTNASGPMSVRRPVSGSPLVDRVPTGSCPTATDQLGTRRPIGAGCDIGAIEYGNEPRSKFVPLPPARIFDTRPGTSEPGPKGVVAAGAAIDVQISGVTGVPTSGATAVVMNVTSTESAGPGFVTVWPTGEPRPNASNLNLTAASQTRPNLVTVPIGQGGKVSIFTQSGTHLLADVAGYYVEVDGPQSAGRLVSLTPNRLFDSRPGAPAPGQKGLIGAGQIATVQISGLGGVPNTGAAAVVLNVTATEPAAPGFISAWPTGRARPNSSILNLNSTGESAPNLVMIPLGPAGTIDLFSSAGAHLIVDVTGYITDATAPISAGGLYVPLSPTRLFDTRPGTDGTDPKGLLPAQSTTTTRIAGMGGIGLDAGAVILNVTATETVAPSFVTTWPSGRERPNTSTLNVVAGDTRANAAIVKLGTNGQLDHYTLSATHLLADTTGYFTTTG